MVLILAFFLFSGCVSSFKLLTPSGEPRVFDRKTRKECPKLYDALTEDEGIYTAYGDPCNIEVRQKIQRVK